jgi:hypothetical protein
MEEAEEVIEVPRLKCSKFSSPEKDVEDILK